MVDTEVKDCICFSNESCICTPIESDDGDNALLLISFVEIVITIAIVIITMTLVTIFSFAVANGVDLITILRFGGLISAFFFFPFILIKWLWYLSDAEELKLSKTILIIIAIVGIVGVSSVLILFSMDIPVVWDELVSQW